MPAIPMTKQDKEWRAKDDARTLTEAEVIKKDLTRLKAAQKAAAKMAQEAADEASSMKKIAGKSYTRGKQMRARKA